MEININIEKILKEANYWIRTRNQGNTATVIVKSFDENYLDIKYNIKLMANCEMDDNGVIIVKNFFYKYYIKDSYFNGLCIFLKMDVAVSLNKSGTFIDACCWDDAEIFEERFSEINKWAENCIKNTLHDSKAKLDYKRYMINDYYDYVNTKMGVYNA